MKKAHWAVLWFCVGCAISLFGCGAESLNPLQGYAQLVQPATTDSSASFTTLDPQVVGNQYKFIFSIDESGSNQSGNPGDNGVGTDATGDRRFDNIVAFIQKQIANGQQASYAAFSFEDSTQVIQNFTADPTVFMNAIITGKANRIDNGGTNFIAAMAETQALIDADATQCMQDPNGVPSIYVVFHLSDGVPVPDETDQQEQSAVNSVMAEATGGNSRCVTSVTIHTGYYHNATDPTAMTTMQNIATWGKGQFIDFGAGQQIDLTRYQIPQSQIQIKLVDVLITNQNTVWENGVLKLDSDGDGLSDDREAQLGSDPNSADSDGNGVGDYVENYLYGTPCAGLSPVTHQGTCTAATARSFTSNCGDLLVSAQGATPVVFKDSDGTGFNDCEKRLLGSRLDRWDSNGDWIPDGVAFFRGLDFLAGTHDESADPFNDSITNRQKIKLGMPIDVDSKTLVGFTPYDYTLVQTGQTATTTSYSIQIKNVPVVGNNNRVRVYVFENTLGVKDIRFMRIAEKQMQGTAGVSFQNSDFATPVKFTCSSSDPCN